MISLLAATAWALLCREIYALFGRLVSGQPVWLLLMGSGVILTLLPLSYFLLPKPKALAETDLRLHAVSQTARKKAHPAVEYSIGLLLGALLFFFVVALMTFSCQISWKSTTDAELPSLLLYAFAFLLQGFGEEALCRAFLFRYARACFASARYGSAFAALYSAGVFALFHIGNKGISPIALLNVFLFGILAALLYAGREGLFLCAAVHGAWNYVQGCICGFPVSGITDLPSLCTIDAYETSFLFQNGQFGPEGELCVTVVFGIAILLLGLLYKLAKTVKPYSHSA